jgi:osmoprotectant transport system permease protein
MNLRGLANPLAWCARLKSPRDKRFTLRAALRIVAMLGGIAVMHGAAATVAGQSPPRVRIGSKSFTESVVLGEMLTHLAAHAGAEAEHRAALGGTQIAFQALEKGEFDAYVEYTGTLTLEIFAGRRLRDDADLHAALAERGIRMSGPLGFNNTYALGMKESLASQLGLRTISDLATRADEPEIRALKFGLSDEFMRREDGWPALQSAYNLPQQPTGLDHSLAYRGVASGSLHVTDLYSTDAEIRHYQLQVLEDDRGCFPAYFAVILYREDLEVRAPEVVRALLSLEDGISNEAMMEMNARVRLDREAERVVAAEFLREQRGMSIAAEGSSRWFILLQDLRRHTVRHLFLVFGSLSVAVLVAVPLGIWAFRRPRTAHAILGVVGVIQTIPSMAVLVFMVPLLGLGVKPALMALFLYSLLPIVRGTYAGLSEIPENLRESAIVLGLSPRARLRLVELPIASRSILSGIKTAAVINVGTATIGGLIGAGGYGEPILTGIRLAHVGLLLQGAIPAATLAVLLQFAFDGVERFIVPRGLLASRG